MSHDAAMPAIGTHVLVLRDGAAESGLYHAGIELSTSFDHRDVYSPRERSSGGASSPSSTRNT